MSCFLWGVLASSAELPAAPAATLPAATLPAGTDAEAEATASPLFREQTIYIPYKRLREVFEEQGRGVFLPYEKFQELWRMARAAEQPTPVERPPVGAIVTEIVNEATVERDVMSVAATLQIELLGKGWHKVPLRLRDAAIRAAAIDGQPARLLSSPETGYELLVKSEGEGPQQITLSLEYAKAYTKSPGQNSVSLDAPQSPVNRWRIRIPQSGVKVQVHPLIAATEVPSEASSDAAEASEGEDQPAEETVVLAFVGAAPEVRVDWTPKAEGASGLEALTSVQTQQELTIEEGVVRTRTRLAYEITRADVAQLILEAPADHKVTRVLDPNVRQWSVEANDEQQTITVQLFQPVRGVQNILVELEKFSDAQDLGELRAPMVRAVGVGRQQGLAVVRLGDELRAEVTAKSGLLQLDQAELPESMKSVPWAFAYRYAALPFELGLRVEKVQPVVQARQLVEAYIEPLQLTLDLVASIDVQKAGLYQFNVSIPAGYEIRLVAGHAAGGCTAAAIDAYRVVEDNILQIDLAQKALGPTGVLIELQRSLDDANLRDPTGVASELVLPVPRVVVPGNQLSGGIVVFASESLRLNPVATAGLRSVPFAEARQSLESVRQSRFPEAREVLAFAHAAEVTTPTLSVERRRPFVTARQLMHVAIDSGVTRIAATFFVDVQYSGVKSLRIDVPTALSDRIRNRTPNVRDAVLAPPPGDVAAGYTAWNFTADREFLGSTVLQLGWEQQGDELEIGRSAAVEIPVLRPMSVDRAWGQIVLTKGETIDIRPTATPESLRPIDPQQDLMPGAAIPNAARAFEFHDDWTLTVTATRYELEEVKRTSIERALVRLVVTRSDRVSVQALYRIRSALQRLAIKLPEGSEFDTDPLYINGQARALETGDQGALFIPLVNQAPDAPFVVELRYTVPGDQTRLDLPVFPSQEAVQTEPAVQKVELSVYLPEEMSLLDSQGPWTNQQADWYRRLNRVPVATGDAHLLDWVVEGVPLDLQHAQTFPTDGRLYSFTTLRPTPPPDGSLRLTAWDTRLLNFVLFGCLALVGLTGVRQPVSVKLVLLALVVVVLVLAGVFAPTLAMQILDENLLVALLLLILLWLVVGAIRLLRRTPARAPVAATTSSVQPVAASDASAPASTSTTSPGDSPFAGESRHDDANAGGSNDA